MKKSYYIIAFLALIIFSGVLFTLTRFNEASLIARDGFFVSGADMDEVLLNENKIAKTPNVSLEKITSNDKFYSNLDKIYVGEEKKTEVNTVYPMYINNGLGVVNMDTNSKLMNYKFEIYDTYENFTVTGGKLYNFGDYEQADFENYILLQLSNGAYINLLPVTITTNSGKIEIPENSVINFQEEFLNYYSYIKKGKMKYNIVDGINLTDKITFGEYKYTYERLLYKLGKYEPPAKEEEVIEEEPEKEEYIIIIKNEEKKPSKYVAPTVKATLFTPNVYSAKSTLSISDPSRVIVGGINFQFYVNDKVYLRKTFVSGGVIEVMGLVPNTSFRITGSYKYYNENSKKMEKTFFEQEIRTLGVDNLEPIDLTFENGEIYPNKIELREFGISSDVKSETTKGVNKAVITVGQDQFSISTGLLQEILMGRKVVYTTPAKLLANTSYNFDIEFLDAYGNKIKIRNNSGSSRTSKNKPTATVKIVQSQVNQVVTQIVLKNVDNANIIHYKYIIFDNENRIIKEENLDSTKESNVITLRDLNPNTTYNIQVLGTYDVENGQGNQIDQVMGEGKFTTAPLNSLGFYRVVASTSELDSDSATISARLDINNINPILTELLNSFSASVTDEDGVLIYAHTFKDEELESIRLGQDFTIELKNLESVSIYNVDFAAVVKQGTTKESVNVLCSFKNFKTYKKKAEIQLRNEFVTGNMIDFDVRIVDIDGAIESPRALLEVRDEAEKLIGKEYLGINEDYIQLTYDHLDTNKNYSFTYLVEEYNIGFSNQTYQSDYIILEKIVTTVEGVKADIELTDLLRQIEGKNLFNIEDYDRIRKEGNTSYKEYDIKNNTVMFGAKNGYVNHSYFLPEGYLKTITVKFKARYSKNTPNKAPVYIGIGNDNNQNFRVNDITDEYKDYEFTYYQYNYYVGFNIVETANINKKTAVDFKDIQIMITGDEDKRTDSEFQELSYHESGYKFVGTEMIDGDSSMPNPSGGTMIGRTGNGYARVTSEVDGSVKTYSYTGGVQEFVAPDFGYYKFEAWGAQGGTYDSYIGGKGAYTSGRLLLNKNTKIYVYVGEKGHANWTVTNTAAWNGGGASGNNGGARSFGGGGSTDFRLVNGAWNNLDSLKSRIMVAAGGGGAVSATSSPGGAGGAVIGKPGQTANTTYQAAQYMTNGGNQVAGGTGSSGYERRGYFGYGMQSNSSGWGGGGGGGYYGGANGHGTTGAGGSSYISGHKGCISYSNREEYLKFEKYKESSQLKGNFSINMYDLRNELVNKDWYVRIYRKGTLVETHQYNLTSSIMENLEKTYGFDKNVNYTVKVSVKVRGRYYDLASVDFTTETEIRAIRTTTEFLNMHTNGKYIVLNDLDFRSVNNGISSYFYGQIDFQGHKIIRNVVNTSSRLFEQVRTGALIKNLVLEYHLDNTSSRTWWYGLITYNRGVLDNIVINVKEANKNPNYIFDLLIYANYGTIQNFVVNAEAPLSAIAGAGYVTWSNQGVMRNGYVQGENIYAYFQNVETRVRKDIGVFTGEAAANSRMEALYSLVSVEKNNNYSTGQREEVVGNMVGYHYAGYIGNSYSVEMPGKVNTNILKQDANIGLVSAARYSKLYYVSDKKYGGNQSSKVSKLALYDKNFQNDTLNKYDGFNVDSFVDLGYFPQVKLNDCMPKQEWIELPKVTEADLIDVTSVEEIENYGDSARIKLHINNPSSEKIEKVTITDIGKVEIVEQKDLYGKTDLIVDLKNPTKYTYVYYVDTLLIKPAYGSSYEKQYDKLERPIAVDLYYPIKNLDDWKKLVSNPSQNYALMNDLDFFNISMTQYRITNEFKYKLDGRGHTIKNITLNDGNGLFNKVNGGTIKNLNIENFKKTNAVGYGGVIYETAGNTMIDNVHLKNIKVHATGRLGGLIGYCAYTTIRNSSVTGFEPIIPVDADDLYVGSFVGYSDYLFLENSYAQDVNINIENAISTLGVGGLAGRMVMGSVNNAYATGKINCNSANVGGLVGYNSAFIQNVWSYVDLTTNLDYVGGIVGKADNDDVSNSLVFGAVYSSYVSNETNNINRTTGNALASVQNNYAWDKQKYYGFVTGESSAELLLNRETLQEYNTYIDLVGFDEINFDLSTIGDDILPKIKNQETGELVPGQKDAVLKEEEFDVLSIEAEPTATNALLHIIMKNPNQFTIDGLEFDSLTVSNARYTNDPIEGTTICDMTVTPTKYFDSYVLNNVKYKDQYSLQQNYKKVIKVNIQFYKELAIYEDWTHISTTTPENYRLTGDIDFTDRPNVRIGVMFNRLEGRLKDDGTNYKIKNYKKTGITKEKTSLIRLVTTSLRNVTFDNIDLESTATYNFINVIYINYADVENVIFQNIKTISKGNYIAPIGRHRGQNFNNVQGNHNTASGKSYVAGIIAATFNTSAMDVSGEYNTVTSTERYCGGLVAYRDYRNGYNAYRFTGRHMTITGVHDVGTLYGYGGAYYSYAYDSTVTTTGGGEYAGGIGGRTSYESENSQYADNITINANSYYVGGLYGWARHLYNSEVRNCRINQTNSGRGYVGGAIGIQDGYTHTNIAVIDTTINNAGSYTGGQTGRLYSGGNLTYTFTNNVTITGKSYVGGVAGIANTARLYYNVTNVNINATGDNVGGVFGHIASIDENETSSSAIVYEVLVANSRIQGNNNVGGFTGTTASGRQLTKNMFYNIIIVADCSTVVTSNPFIGAVSGQDTRLYQNIQLTSFRIYKFNRLNGVYVSSLGLPHIASSYFADATNLGTQTYYTNLNFSTARWDYGKLASGYFPQVKNWSSGSVIAIQKSLLRPTTVVSFSTRRLMDAPLGHKLPDMKIYSSGVDSLNLEFSEVDDYTYFEVYNGGTKVVDENIKERTYTINADYKSEIEVVVSDGINTKKYQVKEPEYRQIASSYGKKYAYIYGGKLKGNISAPKDNFIHIYKNYALTDKLKVFDIDKEEFVDEGFDFETDLINTRPLYKFEYKDTKIDTYYNYSVVHKKAYDVTYDNQILVKNGTIQIVDSQLDSDHNAVIVDEYAEKEYVSVLGLDGTLYDLKTKINKPSRFSNKGIYYMTNNLSSTTSVVVLIYKTGKVVVFDYRTGKEIEQEKANEDVSFFDYFKENFKATTPLFGTETSNSYQEAKDLEKMLKETPIDTNRDGKYVLRDEETKEQIKNNGQTSGGGSITREYITYYNPVRDDYEVVDIESIFEGNDDEVVTENNKIYTSNALVEYYMKESIFEEVFGNINGLYILGGILAAIITALGLFMRNAKLLRVSEEGYRGKEE